MKSLTTRRLIIILVANGFVLKRKKGSHHIYKNQETGYMVAIPLHGGNKPLPLGTFLDIVRYSNISKDKFK